VVVVVIEEEEEKGEERRGTETGGEVGEYLYAEFAGGRRLYDR
jgi:hypothetical protein